MVNISINPDIELDIYSILIKSWGFQNFEHYKVDDKREISPYNLFLLCPMFAWFSVLFYISHSILSMDWLSSYYITNEVDHGLFSVNVSKTDTIPGDRVFNSLHVPLRLVPLRLFL